MVVYRRAGRGTLHRLGPKSCWMARRRGFVKCEVYEQCPAPETYSVRCRLCWPGVAGPSAESTSDSEDELDVSERD